MKIQTIILLFLLILKGTSVTAKENILDKKKKLVISGVTVEFSVTAESFPESWTTEEINAKGESLDLSEIERSTEILREALEKYPSDVLSKNLKKIYVLKSIEFYSLGFGGTNSTDVVYITNDGVDNGYTNIYIEETFHHEFSSILLRNYPEFLNEETWISVNKLEYGNGGVNALRDGTDGLDFDEKLMESGFLIQYATSDLENDFNTFAQSVFCLSPEFLNYCEKYPEIKQKFNLISDFYHQLNPEFSQTYFISLLNE